MNLHLKYRPRTFAEIVGNQQVVESIQTMLADEKSRPHSFLLHGPTGCGKTTIARIMAAELGCAGNDYREVDSADFRGIDTVREIRKHSQFRPLEGPCRVWVIDECFAAGTGILMGDGTTKPIERIQIGDVIKNLEGTSPVKHLFRNKVALDRIVRVYFTDGRSVVCSQEHLFLTSRGWKPAHLLNKKDLTLLQGGCGKSGIENRCGSRWAGAFTERSLVERQEKRGQITTVGVEGVEVYQSGSANRSFDGVVSHKERGQGFVTFYDLEIEGHPSYCANGTLVHNCHKMTNDAQNAMLKILEDTPSHVYFILCTTDPQKLIGTVRGRCSQFQVQQLSDREMMSLLRHVVKTEVEILPRPVYEQIIQDSLGHPRNALQILGQVLSVDPEMRLETAKRAAEETTQAIELCRALIRGAGWKEVAVLLSGLMEQDPEGIRRAVLGYCQAILLKGSNLQAGRVLESFIDPFYDSGKPGLVLACYKVIEGDE